MNRRLAPRRPRRDAGFTLLSVLVSIFIMGIGLLGMVRTMLGVTSSATQNQTVSSIATLSNSFWGVMQWTPKATVVGTGGFVGSYDLTSAAAISGAPANLQPWLMSASKALPAGRATIAVNNSACTTDCVLTVTLSWTQVGGPAVSASNATTTRSQTFYYAL